MLTLSRRWERRKLHLRQCRPLGVHQEVVEKRHLLFHLLNFIPVLVQDVLSYKFWALGIKCRVDKVEALNINIQLFPMFRLVNETKAFMIF